jgi:succinate dehydrogenase / fumarate reductase, cytochrome b subunit
MSRVMTLYRSSVGKKVSMAISGLILFGFIVGHMLGNLKVFQGQEAMDAYALFLREAGYPVVPEYGLVWVARILLLGALLIHVQAAVTLWLGSRRARGQGYRKEESQVFSYASRTMRWGGVIILVFVVYHLLHLTTGTVHPDFEYGSAYANLVIGFQSPFVVGFYLLAVGALCVHLYHGLWSAFATLGSQNRRIEKVRRPLAVGIAWALFVGYAVVPLAVQVGIVSLG